MADCAVSAADYSPRDVPEFYITVSTYAVPASDHPPKDVRELSFQLYLLIKYNCICWFWPESLRHQEDESW